MALEHAWDAFCLPARDRDQLRDRFLATSDDDLRTFFSLFDQPREVGLRFVRHDQKSCPDTPQNDLWDELMSSKAVSHSVYRVEHRFSGAVRIRQ